MPPTGVMVKNAAVSLGVASPEGTILSLPPWFGGLTAREIFSLKDAATVSADIKRLEDLDVTDLCGFVFQAETDAFERTVDFLGSLT